MLALRRGPFILCLVLLSASCVFSQTCELLAAISCSPFVDGILPNLVKRSVPLLTHILNSGHSDLYPQKSKPSLGGKSYKLANQLS